MTASEFCPWDVNLLISTSEDRNIKVQILFHFKIASEISKIYYIAKYIYVQYVCFIIYIYIYIYCTCSEIYISYIDIYAQDICMYIYIYFIYRYICTIYMYI